MGVASGESPEMLQQKPPRAASDATLAALDEPYFNNSSSYFFRLIRASPSPANPSPTTASVAGSGMIEGLPLS